MSLQGHAMATLRVSNLKLTRNVQSLGSAALTRISIGHLSKADLLGSASSTTSVDAIRCNFQAVDNALHFIFELSEHIELDLMKCRGIYTSGGTDHKAVSHFLTAMLRMAQTPTQIRIHEPGWLSVSLSNQHEQSQSCSPHES